MAESVAIFVWGGSEWLKLLADAAGRLQIDVVSSGLPTGGATEATLATLATEVKLEAVRVLLASIAGIDFSTQTTLAALLTELQAKADLTETQPVSAATLPLPTGAATAANQATMITALQLIDDLRSALSSIAADSLDVRLDGQTADVEVIQTTPADLTPGIEGWDGAAWRKLPLLWGYSDRWQETTSGIASGAGDAVANITAVPDGYIYILQRVSVYHDAGVEKEMTVTLRTPTAATMIFNDLAVASGVHYPIQCNAVLKYQDFIRATLVAPGDGKFVDLRVWGYMMKIAE